MLELGLLLVQLYFLSLLYDRFCITHVPSGVAIKVFKNSPIAVFSQTGQSARASGGVADDEVRIVANRRAKAIAAKSSSMRASDLVSSNRSEGAIAT